MKKSLLAVLMMFALVLPVLASESGDMEVVGKLGLNLAPTVKLEAAGQSETEDANAAFALGADFFYNVNPSVALGLGITNVFNSEIKETDGAKIGFTNIYFAVKPKIALESEIFNSLYFLGQVGYGMTRISDADGIDNIENGLYWGIGIGTEIQSFIVEVLYSVNSLKFDGFGSPEKIDGTYSTIALNVGYKFAL